MLDMKNAKLSSLWNPLDCCGTMADGRFRRGHGLTFYNLQPVCLRLLRIIFHGISLFLDVNTERPWPLVHVMAWRLLSTKQLA